MCSVDKPGVSIVVCCYNSESRIVPTIEHLSRQQLPIDGSPVEVILVDNNCSDRTVEVAQNRWAASATTIDLKVVREPKPGLVWARLAGVRTASFDTLVFCDDDNWLCSEYANVAHEVLMKHPSVAIAGGSSTGAYEVPPPEWFDKVASRFAIGGADRTGPLNWTQPLVWGAGMIVRRPLFLQLLTAGFSPLSHGRKGGVLIAGEDAELCFLMTRLGYDLWWDERLRLQHWMPKERLTWDYVVRLWTGLGASVLPTYAERMHAHQHQPLRNRIRMNGVYHFCRCLLKSLPHIPTYLRLPGCEGQVELLRSAQQIGQLKAAIGYMRSFRNLVRERIVWLNHIDADADLKFQADRSCNVM